MFVLPTSTARSIGPRGYPGPRRRWQGRSAGSGAYPLERRESFTMRQLVGLALASAAAVAACGGSTSTLGGGGGSSGAQVHGTVDGVAMTVSDQVGLVGT